MNEKPDYCPKCNLVVEKKAIDRYEVGGDVFHRSCFAQLSNWAQALIVRNANAVRVQK